jgi:hypothetical protein
MLRLTRGVLAVRLSRWFAVPSLRLLCALLDFAEPSPKGVWHCETTHSRSGQECPVIDYSKAVITHADIDPLRRVPEANHLLMGARTVPLSLQLQTANEGLDILFSGQGYTWRILSHRLFLSDEVQVNSIWARQKVRDPLGARSGQKSRRENQDDYDCDDNQKDGDLSHSLPSQLCVYGFRITPRTSRHLEELHAAAVLLQNT